MFQNFSHIVVLQKKKNVQKNSLLNRIFYTAFVFLKICGEIHPPWDPVFKDKCIILWQITDGNREHHTHRARVPSRASVCSMTLKPVFGLPRTSVWWLRRTYLMTTCIMTSLGTLNIHWYQYPFESATSYKILNLSRRCKYETKINFSIYRISTFDQNLKLWNTWDLYPCTWPRTNEYLWHRFNFCAKELILDRQTCSFMRHRVLVTVKNFNTQDGEIFYSHWEFLKIIIVV